jgi:hypothetical protein
METREVSICVALRPDALVDPEDVTLPHGISLLLSAANLAHGVWPPLTANVKRMRSQPPRTAARRRTRTSARQRPRRRGPDLDL